MNNNNSPVIDDLERIDDLECHYLAYSKHLHQKDLTDPEEISALVKLNNTLNRTKVEAGQAVPKTNAECPDVHAMRNHEFLTLLHDGKLDRWREESAAKGKGDPFHAREQELEEEDYIAWEATRKKPKLFMPS